MNVWQQAKQLKYLLHSRSWTGTASKVFGRTIVTSQPRELGAAQGVILPLAVIAPMSSQSDDENPAIQTQTWSISVTVAAHADALGEAGLLGANRSGDQDGRGLFEIEPELLATLHAQQGETGLAIYCRAKSAAGAVVDPELGYVQFRVYTFESRTVDKKYYHPATRFLAEDDAGEYSLTWRGVPDRFDFYRYHIRSAAGDTPPATSSDGTLAGYETDREPASPFTPTGLSGEQSFSIFAEYDETNDVVEGETIATADATSAADTSTVTI